MVDWFLAGATYVVVLLVTVLVATRGPPGALLGRAGSQNEGGHRVPGALEKVVIVLYPMFLACLAAVAWAVLWFGFYAVD
jgi:hypothetical protein